MVIRHCRKIELGGHFNVHEKPMKLFQMHLAVVHV